MNPTRLPFFLAFAICLSCQSGSTSQKEKDLAQKEAELKQKEQELLDGKKRHLEKKKKELAEEKARLEKSKAAASNAKPTQSGSKFYARRYGRFPDGSERILGQADIKNFTSYELKIMRNEIFARHGYIFKTDDMRRYFSQQSWYRPLY
jgi:hypothetical protein